MSRARVLSGLRRLCRARNKVFAGDTHALVESKKAIREQLQIPVKQGELEGRLLMMDEAAHMLRHGIVQGTMNESSGRYEVKVTRDQTVHAEQTGYKPITEKTVEEIEKQKKGVTVTSHCAQGNQNG